jgi:hypothetical protein
MYFLQHRGLVGFIMYGSHEYTARPSRLMVSLAALRVSRAHSLITHTQGCRCVPVSRETSVESAFSLHTAVSAAVSQVK